MRKKRSKKRSKWRFLRNLKKYQTDLNNNGVKMMVTTLASTSATFYVGATTHKGVQEQKNVRNCEFCVTEGPRYMELGRTSTYKLQMFSKKTS